MRITKQEQLNQLTAVLKRKEAELIEVQHKLNVANTQNAMYKEFFDLHFRKGLPSLIKALRVATEVFAKKY